MQMIRVGILLGLLVLFAVAQDAAPDAVQIWTAAALAQGEQALKTEAATDAHHTAVHHLADFPNDTFMLSHREADGIGEWHENQVEVFFGRSGTAALLAGGNMV